MTHPAFFGTLDNLTVTNLDNNRQQMFGQFRNKFPLDDLRRNDYSNCFKRMEVPAKTVFLKEGEISQKISLIEHGCIRVWFNNNGKEVTLQFF